MHLFLRESGTGAEPENIMLDQFGRTIDYLRISVTDRCNLRCRYCMPDGVELTAMERLLTLEEIVTVAECAASLGIRHIKLTGGEPLLRRGLPSLLSMLKAIPGIEKVTLTTNGILLPEMLPDLLRAGLDAVNISLDTTDPECYEEITGRDALGGALRAVDAAVAAGLRTKVNAVSLDLGEENLRSLIALAKDRPVDVRFIEMMPIGMGKTFPVMDHQQLRRKLRAFYPGIEEDRSFHGFGPAVYLRIPGYQGSIGLISAIHGKFCGSCNRVRLTSEGYLKACLCYHEGADLREILRRECPKEERKTALRQAVERVIFEKPGEHCFEELAGVTEAAPMSAIGG